MDRAIIKANERVLVAQSRSFSIPILNLEDQLKHPIMVEYNLNKLMDTIEDNPALPVEVKTDKLAAVVAAIEAEQPFAELVEDLIDITPKDEAHVFTEAAAIDQLYRSLIPPMRDLCKTYCAEMSKGMSLFLSKRVETLKDLNQYCYYVAGTVGLYLTDVVHFYYPFSDNLVAVKEHAKGYGLFLQKLNILRDFHEDSVDKGRSFWPQQLLAEHSKETVFRMIVDTILEHDLPAALAYYNSLPKKAVSYVNFNRFIIMSSLEYLKIILQRKTVFSAEKLKLPRSFISVLYERIKRLDDVFLEKCEQLIIDCRQLV
jgi:farnesyl-diphosphate farnesyltransferase